MPHTSGNSIKLLTGTFRRLFFVSESSISSCLSRRVRPRHYLGFLRTDECGVDVSDLN